LVPEYDASVEVNPYQSPELPGEPARPPVAPDESLRGMFPFGLVVLLIGGVVLIAGTLIDR
jgi:hypothetical protein